MRRLLILGCLVGAMLIVSVPAKADIYIDYNYAMAPDGTLTTAYSGDIFVETFNDAVKGNSSTFDQPSWTWSDGNWEIRLGDSAAQPMEYAAPYNSSLMAGPDTTQYASVPENMQEPTSAMVEFNLEEDQAYDYLGLFWGSVDTYNTFEFLLDGEIVATYDGSIITDPNPANGSQTAPYTNLYVNFYNLPEFDAVRFLSSGWAFEFDNLAVGLTPVPVPGAVLLGVLGLSIAGIKLRKLA